MARVNSLLFNGANGSIGSVTLKTQGRKTYASQKVIAAPTATSKPTWQMVLQNHLRFWLSTIWPVYKAFFSGTKESTAWNRATSNWYALVEPFLREEPAPRPENERDFSLHGLYLMLMDEGKYPNMSGEGDLGQFWASFNFYEEEAATVYELSDIWLKFWWDNFPEEEMLLQVCVTDYDINPLNFYEVVELDKTNFQHQPDGSFLLPFANIVGRGVRIVFKKNRICFMRLKIGSTYYPIYPLSYGPK